MSWRSGGVSGTRDGDRRARHVLLEQRRVQLEGGDRAAQTPRRSTSDGCSSPRYPICSPPTHDARRTTRVQERIASGSRLDLELEADRAEDGLEHALRREERHVAPGEQRADRPRLARQLLARRRQVDVRDLVDRDLLPPERLVARGDVGEARQEQRPHRRVLGRERVREQHRGAPRVVRREAEPIGRCRPARGSSSAPRCSRRRAAPRAAGGAAPGAALSPPVRAPAGSVAGTCSSPCTRATSSTTSISRVTSSARQLGGRTRSSSPLALDRRSRGARGSPRLPDLDVDAGDRRTRPARSTIQDGSAISPAHVDRIGRQRRAGQLDEHARGGAVRDRRELGVDALLEAVRRLGADAEAPRRAQDRAAVERRGLEHDLGRVVGDLGIGAAHHARDARRAVAVGDHERLGVELALACRRASSATSPATRTARDQRVPRDAREVVGVQRLAEVVRDVVRHVDDVRDRADADPGQPRLQPERRGRDAHAGAARAR